MSYDDTSYYGDRFVDEYDDKNNFIGTETPMGYYVYHIIGDSLDLMNTYCTEFMNNMSILSTDSERLDKYWGRIYDMPRPSIARQGTTSLLTDDEYRIYLYLRNTQLITREDLEIAFNNCFSVDDYMVRFTVETNYLSLVDHLNYEARETEGSNIAKQSTDETKDFVTDYDADADTELIQSGLSTDETNMIVVQVPANNWDSAFLSLLEQYVSVKGNIRIGEYTL